MARFVDAGPRPAMVSPPEPLSTRPVMSSASNDVKSREKPRKKPINDEKSR
jgi:hypothetical protein